MPADSYAVAFPVGESSRPRRAEQGSGNQNPITMRGSLAAQSNRIDDTSLIREAQEGNRAAFEVLVRHYDQSVLRLALHLTGSESDAQDVYQEAFLKAYKNLGSFRFECSFYTWIYRIVTNLCLDICGNGTCARKKLRLRWTPRARSTAAWSSSRMCARSESGTRSDATRTGAEDRDGVVGADASGAHGI